MVLFDVIHVVNTKSPEADDKSFLYTALEVFCLGETQPTLNRRGRIFISISNWSQLLKLLHHHFWIFDDGIELPSFFAMPTRFWGRERGSVSCKWKGIHWHTWGNTFNTSKFPLKRGIIGEIQDRREFLWGEIESLVKLMKRTEMTKVQEKFW
jgi:hypothetical protein